MKIISIIIAVLLVAYGIYAIKNNPSLLSKSQLSKSATTIGLLTLLLIAMVTIAVLLLRQ